jgi:hypothetical protein
VFGLSLDAIFDLLGHHAQPTFVISRMNYFAWDRNRRAERSLADLARVNRIDFNAYRDVDAVAIWRDDLPAFLNGVYHWNVDLWDARNTPAPDLVNRQVAIMGSEARWKHDTAALHRLDGARLFVHCHDNDTLWVESHGTELPRNVFTRWLQAFIAGLTKQSTGQNLAKIAELPDTAIDQIWSSLPEFELRTNDNAANSRRIVLAFGAPGRWFPGVGDRPDFEPRGQLIYDIPIGAWTLRHQ